MSDTIQRIEEEIRKLEARLRAMEKEKTGSPQDQKVHAATASLLREVINDLRKQQRKLQAEESVAGRDQGKSMERPSKE